MDPSGDERYGASRSRSRTVLPVTDGFFEPDPQLMPLVRLLSRTGQAVVRYTRGTTAAHGLTTTAMGVLGVLADTDAVSHRELSGKLGVAPATLTPVVDALEAEGEVVRERDPADRRVVRLWITPSGRERLAEVHGDVMRMFLRLRTPRSSARTCSPSSPQWATRTRPRCTTGRERRHPARAGDTEVRVTS
jgi:DNA-binding MarR family transcriptional regulator